MAISLGEAIAAGTLAQPVRSQPLTNAVNKYQQVDLAQKAAEAKRLKEEADLQNDLAKMINYGDGGFSPLFQDEIKDYTTKSLAKQYGALKQRDRIGLNSESAQLKHYLEDKKVEDKALQTGLSALEKEGLLTTNLSRIPSSRRAEAIKIYQDEVAKNPALSRILTLDENGRFAAHQAANIDIDKDLATLSKSLDKITPVVSNGKRETVRLGDTTYYKTQADPNVVAQQAFAMTQDPNVVTNVMLKLRPDYEKAFVSISQDPAHQDKTPDQLQTLAAAEVIRQRLTGFTQGHEEIRDRAPRSSNSTNINFANSITPLNIQNGIPQNSKIPLKVTTSQGEVTRNVPTGNPYSFKIVEVLNTRGEGFINADTNKPIEGRVFQSIKTGGISAVPIAQADFQTSSGVKYKKGEMVDEKSIAGLTQNGLVSYQPMVRGEVKYKKGNREITESVLAPVESIKGAIITTQSKDDATQIDQIIQQAAKESSELNVALMAKSKVMPSVKKTAAKKSTTKYKGVPTGGF